MKKIDLLRESSGEEVETMVEHVDVSKYEPIEGSPFTAIKVNEKWLIVMGDEVASAKKFDTLIELEHYIESKPWELIVTSSNIFGNIVGKKKELENKNAEKEVKNEK